MMSAVVERVSIVCGCRDRHDMLARTLPSWLAHPEVAEVVIVDWSSWPPIQTVTARLGDPRIKIARVEGQPRWVASKCHNLGARVASGEILLRVDSDYLLRPHFFRRHTLLPNAFFCGNWRRARNDNERHLTGTLYVHRHHFMRVNGYNERIVTYGYEDDDLFERLEGAGLARGDVDFDTVYHIPHSDALRVAHQDVRDLQLETARNKALARSRPWTDADQMTDWDVRLDPSGAIVCARR